MSSVSSFQSNSFYSYSQDATFSLPDESSPRIVPLEIVFEARETAARALLDKNSNICRALLNADIFVYPEPSLYCSCPSNSQDPTLSPHNEEQLTAMARETITRVREVAGRAIRNAYPDFITPGCLSLNEINTEVPFSPSEAKKRPPSKKKKAGALKRRQSVLLQKTPNFLSAPLLLKEGPLTDEGFEAIKEIKEASSYSEEHFRDTLDGIFYKFSTLPTHTWEEVGNKFNHLILDRIEASFRRWSRAGLFTRMAAVLNKPELTNLIEHGKAVKAQSNCRLLNLPRVFRILKNDEWNLIEPFIPPLNHSRYSNRDCFDGILHKYTSKKSLWELIKKSIKNTEYKFQKRIRVKYDSWKKKGVFTAIYEELDKKNLFFDLKKKLDIILNHPNEKSSLPPNFGIVTDEEWSLIEPFNERHDREHSSRDCFNAILHKYAGEPSSGEPSFWEVVKRGLGNDERKFEQCVRLQYGKWIKNGFFITAYKELAKNKRFPKLQKRLDVLIQRFNENSKLPPGFSIITDREWDLISPLVPTLTRCPYYSNRDCFNGILHKYTSKADDWNLLKEELKDPRYKFQRRIRAQYDKWKRDEIFADAYNELVKNNLSPALQQKLDVLIKSPSKASELTSSLGIVTDEEWDLIKPFIIESPEKRYSSRDCLNGILYKYAGEDSDWDMIKQRLGNDRAAFQKRINDQYQTWKEDGFFSAVHNELLEKKVFPELREKLAVLMKGSNTSSSSMLLSLEIDSNRGGLDSLINDFGNEMPNSFEAAEGSARVLRYVDSNILCTPRHLPFPEIVSDPLPNEEWHPNLDSL